MTEVRWARPEDEPELRAFWREAFPGEEAYLDCYFTHRFRPEQTLLLTVSDRPVSMLAALPMALVGPAGETLPAAYLYGVATRRENRRQGRCQALLAAADRLLAGAALRGTLLVPATELSHAVFRGAGYRDVFSLRAYEVTDPGAAAPAAELTPQEYGRRRDALLAGRYHARCDAAALAFALRFAQVTEGGLYGTQDGCALADRLPDGTVLVRELLTRPGREDALLAAMAAALPARRYHVRVPEWLADGRGTVRRFGMDHALPGTQLPEGPGWLGIAYD